MDIEREIRRTADRAKALPVVGKWGAQLVLAAGRIIYPPLKSRDLQTDEEHDLTLSAVELAATSFPGDGRIDILDCKPDLHNGHGQVILRLADAQAKLDHDNELAARAKTQ